MEEVKKNKMAVVPMKKLFWKMGLPMIVSMVLQALYNVVDSIFVTNMGENGAIANQALTLAFPIQILIIAIGVGTGVGINALLSKSLGEKNFEKVNKVAGNGIFLGLIITICFMLFGAFGSRAFISLFASDELVVSMGSNYLRICCILSLGGILYTIYERFLQATGKTMLSTISQISGAVTNIVLDYVFIFPLNMGVEGAAYATVIGQFLSMALAMIFHYNLNKEIDGSLKFIKPNLGLIKGIYQIGVSAALMQTLLSVMMAGTNAILGSSKADPTILVGSFGIYYKIQQIALFSAFGLSNTIISILSFNYGMKDKKRVDECIKYGIIDTVLVTFLISVLFEIFGGLIAKLFGLAGSTSEEIINTCTMAIRIASIGYIFMGFSVACQGVLQSFRYALRPLIISLLRLVIFVFPLVYFFTLSDNVINVVWFAFPISEVLTAIISIFILKNSYNIKVTKGLKDSKEILNNKFKNIIICISREHGTNGKEIGKMVAKELNFNFYDKEELKNYAVKSANINTNNSEEELYDLYLSLDAEKEAIYKQTEVLKEIANKNENCVIVGRAADYILRNAKNMVSIFLYASNEYRVNKIMEIYKDNEKEAIKYMKKSDTTRKQYYELISNRQWGNIENYNLCINCEIGNDKVKEIICNYVNKLN